MAVISGVFFSNIINNIINNTLTLFLRKLNVKIWNEIMVELLKRVYTTIVEQVNKNNDKPVCVNSADSTEKNKGRK